MEEYVDLKKQVKLLEDKTVEYVQQSIEHEQDLKKLNNVKSQLDIYKKQVIVSIISEIFFLYLNNFVCLFYKVTDLHEKWDAEIAKADRLEIENKKLNTKLSAIQREKDNLMQERNTLKETCEELKCSTLQSSGI